MLSLSNCNLVQESALLGIFFLQNLLKSHRFMSFDLFSEVGLRVESGDSYIELSKGITRGTKGGIIPQLLSY